MSKNPYGGTRRMNVEWGAKGRKEENDLRGLNQTARREAIAEQVADWDEEWDLDWQTRQELEQDFLLLDDALDVGLTPGVTFNGRGYDNSYEVAR